MTDTPTHLWQASKPDGFGMFTVRDIPCETRAMCKAEAIEIFGTGFTIKRIPFKPGFHNLTGWRS